MVCLPVRGDNSTALESGLSPVQAHKLWYITLISVAGRMHGCGYVPLRFGGTSLGEWEHNKNHQCRPCSVRKYSILKFAISGKGRMNFITSVILITTFFHQLHRQACTFFRKWIEAYILGECHVYHE